MNKAYKFRIFPNKDQQILLAKTFGSVRFIYNKMLNDKIEHYTKTKENLYCYPSQYKDTFEWLKEVDSLALNGAYNNLQAAYNNFFKNPTTGFPKFKSKKNARNSYTTNCIKTNIKLENGYIVLPKLKRVKIKQHRAIPHNYILKSVTVSQTPSGKYFVSILFEYDKIIEPVDIKTSVGLDFSMKELYVASDGTTACYPRYYRMALDRLAKEQRKLSKMAKGSNNRYKQRLKVARLHEKVANQRKDFLHKLSKQITNVYDCVCVETLDLKTMSQKFHFGKSVHDNAFGMFVTLLKYKIEDQGKRLIKIDKMFPSSKLCSHCGYVKEKLELSERTYICEHCGLEIDRDYNASLNIQTEGMRLILP